MDLRKSICDSIELLIENFKYKINDQQKEKLTLAWHLGLDDIPDHKIVYATQKAIKELEWMPVPKQIRTFAKHLSIKKSDRDFVPIQDQALNDKNFQAIINRLKLPEKLKQDQFSDFKKNRKTIESNRKERVKNASLRILHRD